MNDKHFKAWADFQKKGLCKEIKSWEDYSHQFSKNSKAVDDFLDTKPEPITKPEDILTVHGLLFHKIYPWAGSLKDHTLQCRGREGTPPLEIVPQLELLQTQTKILIDAAEHETALIRTVAFQHTRLTNIQTFGDGNSRTSRAIADHFLTLVTTKTRSQDIKKKPYFNALETALFNENLKPLSDLFHAVILQKEDPTDFLPSPFQTTHYQTAQSPERQDISLINALETPKAFRWLNKFPWESVEAALGGKPSKTFEEAKTLWTFARHRNLTRMELAEVFDALADLKPVKHGLFVNPTKTKERLQTLRKEIISTTTGTSVFAGNESLEKTQENTIR
jgi:fido (protein-threonine AMPylation protein)